MCAQSSSNTPGMDDATPGASKPVRLLAPHRDLVDRLFAEVSASPWSVSAIVSKPLSNAAPRGASPPARTVSARTSSKNFRCAPSSGPQPRRRLRQRPARRLGIFRHHLSRISPRSRRGNPALHRRFASRRRISPTRSSPISTASRVLGRKIRRSFAVPLFPRSQLAQDMAPRRPRPAPHRFRSRLAPFRRHRVESDSDGAEFGTRHPHRLHLHRFPNPAHDSSPDPHRSRYLALFSDALDTLSTPSTARTATAPPPLLRRSANPGPHRPRTRRARIQRLPQSRPHPPRTPRPSSKTALRSGQFGPQNGT